MGGNVYLTSLAYPGFTIYFYSIGLITLPWKRSMPDCLSLRKMRKGWSATNDGGGGLSNRNDRGSAWWWSATNDGDGGGGSDWCSETPLKAELITAATFAPSSSTSIIVF